MDFPEQCVNVNKLVLAGGIFVLKLPAGRVLSP